MSKPNTATHNRIVQDPAIMVGKPVVAGTRIPVERVVAHLAENPDLDDLFAAFPHLTLEDVKACLAFARDALACVEQSKGRKALVRAATTHA